MSKKYKRRVLAAICMEEGKNEYRIDAPAAPGPTYDECVL